MVSDTSFDQRDLEAHAHTQDELSNSKLVRVGGTNMNIESGMWRIIDIRSKTTIESETRGGGGHVTGYGGFVSGNISPTKTTTRSHTTYTYFLEKDDGNRMHFGTTQELDAIVGDDIFVVTSEREKKPKALHIPMIYIPAYNKWEIWKSHISEMVRESKAAKIFWGITYVIAGLFALFAFIGTSAELGPIGLILVGPLTGLLTFVITALLFFCIYWLSFMPARMRLKRNFKKMQ